MKTLWLTKELLGVGVLRFADAIYFLVGIRHDRRRQMNIIKTTKSIPGEEKKGKIRSRKRKLSGDLVQSRCFDDSLDVCTLQASGSLWYEVFIEREFSFRRDPTSATVTRQRTAISATHDDQSSHWSREKSQILTPNLHCMITSKALVLDLARSSSKFSTL